MGRIVGAVGSFLGRAAPQLDLGQCTMAIGGDTVFEGGDTSRPSPRRPAPPPKHRPSNLLGSSPLGSFRLSPTREASLSAHLRQAAGGTTARPLPGR